MQARAGGLYLALEEVKSEKDKILMAATGEGATLVSDGAKLKSRKRGMLNSGLSTRKGTIFLQQTDATGKTKNAEFLRDDYSSAIKKAGPVSEIKMEHPDGSIVSKEKSSVVRLLVTDRGGGCERALTLTEEKWIILTDTCKGHGADLLIEDWAILFKPHLKKVHKLILFILNHDVLYGLFVSYVDVLALLIPADTRFATEIICARSLQKDMSQVKHLFVDPQYKCGMQSRRQQCAKSRAQ